MKKHKGLIPKQCEECKKVFYVYFSQTNRRFCSSSCRILYIKKLWENKEWRETTGNKIIKNLIMEERKYFPKKCVVCGKEFTPRKGKQLTCSRKCGCKIRKRYQGEIKVKCSYCGKELLRPKKIVLKQKYFWCSKKCMAEIKKEQFKGENNPRWSGGKIEKKCVRCGKVFFEYKKNPQKYCSRKCFRKASCYNLKNAGSRAEREARDTLKEQGYLVIKSGGSFGIFDLWAVNDKELRLIQVKRYFYPHKSRDIKQRILHKFREEINEIKNLNVIGNKELWVKTKEGWLIESIK
jgi:hypothetical protein